MRNAFAKQIHFLASEHPNLVLLAGDIGNRLFDPFKRDFPSRFFNCGVAEANMTGVAAGLALASLRPVTYTIAPFNTTRCLEQIRNDICYQNLPVIIVGTGAGLSYASLGATHHSCEDIALLRTFPNMTILCPGDQMELQSLLSQALCWHGPVYLRIGKTGEPQVHSSPPQLTIGKGLVVKKGSDGCLLVTGNMLPTALQVADLLQKKGFNIHLVQFHTIKPLDTSLLLEIATSFPLLITLEEHSLIGGLGSAVSEWLVDQPILRPRCLRFGTPDKFAHPVGSQSYLREEFQLTPQLICEQILYQTQGKKYEDNSSHSPRHEPSYCR